LTFGNMAYDAMLDGKTGLMSALLKGCYELVPIPDPKLGPRKLDVATMYNTERYRPMYANKRGLPVFLQARRRPAIETHARDDTTRLIIPRVMHPCGACITLACDAPHLKYGPDTGCQGALRPAS
jgi:hypothetical protein